MELGILTIHCRMKHPQTQGKDESFNRNFTRECLKYNEISDIESAQKIFDEYRNVYNNIRPHHSLDLDVPAKHYERSNREYNPDIKEWEYPKEAKIRKVKETGFFSFANQGYFLSEAFANKEIAVCNSPRKDCIDLYFRQFHIGRINTDKRCFEFKKAYLIKDDPREFLLQKV